MRLYPASWRRDASDAEVVEAVRANLKKIHKMRWLWPATAILMACFGITFINLFVSNAGIFPESKQMQYCGFFIGVLFGFVFCVTMAQAAVAVFNWLDWKWGYRTPRLLVKYFDMARQQQPSTQPLQPTAGAVGTSAAMAASEHKTAVDSTKRTITQPMSESWRKRRSQLRTTGVMTLICVLGFLQWILVTCGCSYFIDRFGEAYPSLLMAKRITPFIGFVSLLWPAYLVIALESKRQTSQKKSSVDASAKPPRAAR